ncbi:MAG: ABC transporter ATP-binding protein [Nitrososphaeraceae archaeon]
MLAIDAEHISKTYDNNCFVINDISIKINTGQIFTLLGRNGAGKTTFMKICATQLLPTSGKLKIFDYDIIKDVKKIRELISVVPQEARPLRALTPWDHVYNWLKIRGSDKTSAKMKTKEMLEKLELWDVRNILAMNLSGGMKQKILVAMAMAIDAELLFLDEPTIGLDPISRRQVWSTIQKWKKKGKTIFLTTHYMDEAEMLSDKICIIDQGNILKEGTINQLREVIPYNIRIDLAKKNKHNEQIDFNIFKTYGELVNLGTDKIRLFVYERHIDEVSKFAIKNNIVFNISPVTLDDIFISIITSNKNNNKQ